MRELSLFVDESGSDSLADKYYLFTIVLHEQNDDIRSSIERYELSLREKGLPDIPFHASPLLNGKGDYCGMPLAERKMLWGAFRVFFRHAPIKYRTFVFKTREFESVNDVANAMRRKLVEFLFDWLDFFQAFEAVKIYYDISTCHLDAVSKSLLANASCAAQLLDSQSDFHLYI